MTNGRSRQRTSRAGWEFERLEDRTLLTITPTADLGAAIPLTAPTGTVSGMTAPGVPVLYQVAPFTDSLLIANVHAPGTQTRLSVVDAQGNLLTQSDGESPTNQDDLISFHLSTTTTYLEVQSLGGTGPFTLSYQVTPSSDPNQPLPQSSYGADIFGDFNNDGKVDLVNNDGFHAGVGDGTFDPVGIPLPLPYVGNISASGDFNGDGNLDLALADNVSGGGIQILMGNGDGTFNIGQFFDFGQDMTESLVVGDFEGNGRDDIAVALDDPAGNLSVEVLLGNPDGTLTALPSIPLGQFVLGNLENIKIVKGVFTEDGHVDLAVAGQSTGSSFDLGPLSASVLLGNGDGTFRVLPSIVLSGFGDQGTTQLVAGDFNGDGLTDLAIASGNEFSDGPYVDTLLSNGDGTFRVMTAFVQPSFGFATVVADDFNGDGRTDLMIASDSVGTNVDDEAEVLLSNGDGTFRAQPPIDLGNGIMPVALSSVDFNGDGVADVALTERMNGNYAISLLRGNGDGTFSLPANRQFQTIADSPNSGDYVSSSVTGNFTGGDFTDLLLSSGIMMISNGDGTFRAVSSGLPNGFANPAGLVAADLTGYGLDDLVSAESNYSGAESIEVYLSGGDGTFLATTPIVLSIYSSLSIAVGDFNGDGRPDIAAIGFDSSGEGIVQILLNNGDGTFRFGTPTDLGLNSQNSGIATFVAGNFSGGRFDDLAFTETANSSSADNPFPEVYLQVLVNQGDATFQLEPPMDLGSSGYSTTLKTGHFTDDGRDDLVFSNGVDPQYGGIFEPLFSNGGGTFAIGQPILVNGLTNASLLIGDFNGDGLDDIALAGEGFFTGEVDIATNNGDGAFTASPVVNVGFIWSDAVGVGHFSNDDLLDLAVTPAVSNTFIEVLSTPALLSGQEVVTGAFSADGESFRTKGAIATGDFNGDGRLDLAAVDTDSSDAMSLQVDLGNGDGTFAPQPSLPVGFGVPVALLAGSFSASNSTDLVLVGSDFGFGFFEELTGNGNGTFGFGSFVGLYNITPDGLYNITPVDAVSGDFTNDGRDDLAIAGIDSTGNVSVDVFLSNADGTFTALPPINLGSFSVQTLVVGHFTNDGALDLAVGGNVSAGNAVVEFLLGNGDGTFRVGQTVSLSGLSLTSLVSGQFSASASDDLAVLGQTGALGDMNVEVLTRDEAGTFNAGTPIDLGEGYAEGLLTGDINGDGRPDLMVVSGFGPALYQLLPGIGDGMFGAPTTTTLTAFPVPTVVGDFNRDGRTDLAFDNAGNFQLAFSIPDGDFSNSGSLAGAIQDTPIVADLGSGVDDVFVVSQSGAILWRKGDSEKPGTFDPPVTINLNPTTQQVIASRDIVLVPTKRGPVIASVDSQDNAVSLFAYEDGQFSLVGTLATGPLPVQVVGGDLNGDGDFDLVIRNAGDGTATVYLGDGNGEFKRTPDVLLGFGVSDIMLTDLFGNGRLDLVATNQNSGEIRVLPSNVDGTFADASIYPAGAGPFQETINADGTAAVTSGEATAGAATGIFSAGSTTGLVTLDPGTASLAILAGLADGGLANPVHFLADSSETVVRSGSFSDNGITDLALLGRSGVSVYIGNGQGGFDAPQSYPVDPNSTGLTIADVNNDGIADLLVGNGFGDVQVLLGNGKGGFSEPNDVNRQIALAVASVGPHAPEEFVYANYANNSVSVQAAGSTTPQALTVQDPAKGVLAPSAVTYADLNGDGIPDAIVANSGGNDVLVYLGETGGGYASAQAFPVGTDPVSVTVADLNGDGIPDLAVANQGSNDVSVLLGQEQGASWSLTPQLRLQAGYGPAGIVVADVNHDGIPDVVVTDSQSNQVRILPGVGSGFFNDSTPLTLPTGTDPGPVFVGNFTGNPGELDLLTVNTGSNNLSEFLDVNGAFVPQAPLSTQGEAPVSAVEGEFVGTTTDLLVANLDGTLALFVSGPNGLSLMKSFEVPGLPNPTSLAVDNSGAIFGASAGVEAAVEITLGLGGESGTLVSLSGPEEQQVVELQPLTPSSLAMVATLLSTSTTIESEATLGIGFAAPPNQGLNGGGVDEEQDEEVEPEDTDASLASFVAQPLPRPVVEFLIGFNDELANLRLRAHEGSLLRGISIASATSRPLSAGIAPLVSGFSVPGRPAIPATSAGAAAATAVVDAALDALVEFTRNQSVPRSAQTPASSATRSPDHWSAAIGATSVALMVLARPLGDAIRPTRWRQRSRTRRSQ